jgi:hypothetical protein
MLVGLAGLHSAGKSHITRLLTAELGWYVLEKRKLLQDAYLSSNHPDDMHRITYGNRGAYIAIQPIIPVIAHAFTQHKVVVLDAVHNADEWRKLRKEFPDSLLVAVITPRKVRFQRPITRSRPNSDWLLAWR